MCKFINTHFPSYPIVTYFVRGLLWDFNTCRMFVRGLLILLLLLPLLLLQVEVYVEIATPAPSTAPTASGLLSYPSSMPTPSPSGSLIWEITPSASSMHSLAPTWAPTSLSSSLDGETGNDFWLLFRYALSVLCNILVVYSVV